MFNLLLICDILFYIHRNVNNASSSSSSLQRMLDVAYTFEIVKERKWCGKSSQQTQS